MSLSSIEQKLPRGLVHLYVGDGKGKTTAAVGLAIRAAGQGQRVVFCQFLKSSPVGEAVSLEKLGVQVLRAQTCGKFYFQMTREEKEQEDEYHRECLEHLGKLIQTGDVDVAVLDEAVDAENSGIFLPGSLERLVRQRGHAEIVLTGRNPTQALVDLADYHTNFVCVSHPFQKGTPARQGIEF